MASIFKRGREKRKRHACYYIEYTDHIGKRRTKKGFTDKALTEQLAAKLENEALLRREGLIDPVEEEAARRKESPLTEHLAKFEASLTRSDITIAHVKLTMSRIRRIVEKAGFKCAREIDADSVEQVMREYLATGKIGHRTYNHYLKSMYQFCKWLSNGKRAILPHNPLAGMERLNTEVDVRHPRRALKPEEFAKLVKSARTSGIEIQCFDGEQRARIYLLSYFTGLRRKELGDLTPKSFQLDGHPPTLTVEATSSKHRRKDILPLHNDLVAMLHEWLKEYDSDEPLFPKLGKRQTWLMVRRDLERVGIPYQTDEGFADFHAAGRHTHITELLRNGVSLAEAKELARHSDVRMTMKYAHIGIDDQSQALQSLPVPLLTDCQHIGSISRGIERPGLAHTGTENPGGPPVHPTGASISVAPRHIMTPPDTLSPTPSTVPEARHFQNAGLLILVIIRKPPKLIIWGCHQSRYKLFSRPRRLHSQMHSQSRFPNFC